MSEFLPTPEGAEAVLRAGRCRRTAKASATGSTLLAAMVALVLTTGGNSARPEPDRLVTTPSPTVAATASASPTAASRTQQSTSPAAVRDEGEGPVPTLFPSPRTAASSPPPALRRSSAARRAPITRGTGSIAATDLCTDGQTDQARNWCVRTFDPGEIRRGTKVVLGGELCNYPTSYPLTIEFADTAQVQMAIDPFDNQDKWHAGEGYTYAKPGPTITIAPGQCLQWRSPWDTRDREGFVVPPGSYQLNVYVNTKDQPGYIAWRNLTVVD